MKCEILTPFWPHTLVVFFRIWLCCFTMTVSLGAVLLLPFSIISNEVLLRYPESYYIKWLNDSLLQGTYRISYASSHNLPFDMQFLHFLNTCLLTWLSPWVITLSNHCISHSVLVYACTKLVVYTCDQILKSSQCFFEMMDVKTAQS